MLTAAAVNVVFAVNREDDKRVVYQIINRVFFVVDM